VTTAYTSLLGLALPVTGELSGTWGDTVNNAITSLLDSAVAGTTTITSDADVTLTTTTGAANTSREAILLWTASGTVTRTITAPAQSKVYVVINKTGSTQSIKLVGAGPTAGVTIIAGESAVCSWNGVDFIKVGSTIANAAGSNTQVQFNNSGVLGGSANLTWSGTALSVTGTVAVTGALTTNTLTSAASTALTLQSAGTTALTIDTSQNVGIGTASPTKKLDVSSSTQRGQIAMSGTNVVAIRWASTDPNASERNWEIVNNVDGQGFLSFRTGATQGADPTTTRMVIDSSGNLLVGATSGSTKMYVVDTSASVSTARFFKNVASSQAVGALTIDKFDNTSTTAQIFVQFTINNQGTGSGQINANGASAAAFGSFSDSRLKENIVDLPSQLSNIMALRPVEFDYIESEGGGHQIGFIAQEVNEIYPDLVGKRADGMFTLTDMNKNDARLIKCIQEMKALIDTQAKTINALTARIVALEAK
jgi:hypothetical protein